MRRADRLFQIVQILRRDRITTAAALGKELSVSVRTVYRDVADLCATGVPIEGEAGAGYRLPQRFDLPPLMFTADELEALVVGARIAQAWGDPQLIEAAKTALRKVEAVVPAEVRRRLEHSEIHAPDFFAGSSAAQQMGTLRPAMRERRKVRIRYRRADGTESERIVHPLGLFFWGYTWSLAAWCELRKSLRTFRVDRILGLEALPEAFEPVEGGTLQDYLRNAEAETVARDSQSS